MKKYYDKVILALSALVLLISAVFSFWVSSNDQETLLRDSPVSRVYRPYEPLQPAPNPRTAKPWTAPSSQSWGAKAIFEVFTPPIIYYHKNDNSFTLDPPLPPEKESPFGLELVEVLRDLYRIQYEGFVGQESDPLILLKNEETGEGIRGRVGQKLEEAFSILFFEVERGMVEQGWGTPIMKEEITLILFDERLGEEVLLSREPRYSPRVYAILRSPLDPEKMLKHEEGDTFEVDGAKYTLQTIDFETQSVTVEKEILESKNRHIKTLVTGSSSEPDTSFLKEISP